MRTTITLDPDVEVLLKKLMNERGVSFKEAVNDALRAALLPKTSRVDYAFPTYNLGRPMVPLERALQVAAALEDDEIARKLAAGR